MLVLRRHREQSVILDLGDGRIAKVVVVETGRQVRLGFIAPASVKIHRDDSMPEECMPSWYRRLIGKTPFTSAPAVEVQPCPEG